LKHDRQQRILGIRALAEKGIGLLTPSDRQQFEDYARGVNAYINSHRHTLPLEFGILRYSPQPWTAQDSLLIAYQMVETLSTGPQAALTREKILAKLGPELTDDLYVNRSWRDRPPTQPLPAMDEPSEDNHPSPAAVTFLSHRVGPTLPGSSAWSTLLAPLFRDEIVPIGSNNWVVSGAHTVSGKPLLSNDMHLGHQMPNLWYEVHLRSGDFDVAGVSLPGHPYVIVGHNQRIAWGLTNLGPTVEDAYIETINDAGQYLTPQGWKQPDTRVETIHVKGKPDVIVNVQLTRHGPIVSELAEGESRRIALRWTLFDGTRDPFFRVNSAHNWQEFQKAFSEFDAPGQNVVYADVEGNIGYQLVGTVSAVPGSQPSSSRSSAGR